ncbi:MAG: cation-translocating P-type ATPase C-terminal domain-containing protein, partial [Verrucomicrobiales bacterium]|nr:cation-translocating P-type ATPase C-terminal domain-containing protein [Verrucomicrobiales bacterium]
LFLNLVTDVFPALALGVGRGDAGVMGHPPRDPGEAFLPGYWWWGIVGYACAISSAVLGAMAAAIFVLGMDSGEVVTVCFLTLGFAQIWHVYNMRDRGSEIFRNDITENRVLWGALVVCVVLLLCAVHVPTVSTVLGTEAIGWRGWVLTLGMSAVPLVWGGIFRLWSRRPSIGGRPRLVA